MSQDSDKSKLEISRRFPIRIANGSHENWIYFERITLMSGHGWKALVHAVPAPVLSSQTDQNSRSYDYSLFMSHMSHSGRSRKWAEARSVAVFYSRKTLPQAVRRRLKESSFYRNSMNKASLESADRREYGAQVSQRYGPKPEEIFAKYDFYQTRTWIICTDMRIHTATYGTRWKVDERTYLEDPGRSPMDRHRYWILYERVMVHEEEKHVFRQFVQRKWSYGHEEYIVGKLRSRRI